MMVWRGILEPKNPNLTFKQAGELAEKAGYNLLSYEGKIYRLHYPQPEVTDWVEDTQLSPEMFNQPDIYCITEKHSPVIACNNFGPLLFANMLVAQAMAEKLRGNMELFWKAIWLQVKAKKENPSATEGSRIIIPGR